MTPTSFCDLSSCSKSIIMDPLVISSIVPGLPLIVIGLKISKSVTLICVSGKLMTWPLWAFSMTFLTMRPSFSGVSASSASMKVRSFKCSRSFYSCTVVLWSSNSMSYSSIIWSLSPIRKEAAKFGYMSWDLSPIFIAWYRLLSVIVIKLDMFYILELIIECISSCRAFLMYE